MPILNKLVIFDEQNINDSLKKALSIEPKDVVMEVRESGLKGRGGAGFPTGTKWMLASSANSKQKYVVCNADEGEPGTFKARVLLDEYTKLVFEGMVIGGYAIGANKGFLYLRGEYRYLLDKLNSYLEQMRKENRLGNNILGTNFSFDIEIRLGSGAYVCGEESALIESLEGHRGEARNRPPFPVNTGYLGCPTIVNNVETLLLFISSLQKVQNGTASMEHQNQQEPNCFQFPAIAKNPAFMNFLSVLKSTKFLSLLKQKTQRQSKLVVLPDIAFQKQSSNVLFPLKIFQPVVQL
jgi:[NiFe] hydrogenase diaphorase moiety large subunit